MSLRIDEYLSYCGEVSELLKNQTASQNVSTQDAASKDTDSYVSTVGSLDAAIPSENYNDILKVIQKAKAESGQSQGSAASGGGGQTQQASASGLAGQTQQASVSGSTGQTQQASVSGSSTGQTQQTSGTGTAGGAGGSGESDDESTTTTKTVVINGVTYLETTTVEDGVTSVQRTQIGGVSES